MDALISVIDALAKLLVAIGALAAWHQSHLAARRSKDIKKELNVNPEKSAIETAKILNGHCKYDIPGTRIVRDPDDNVK